MRDSIRIVSEILFVVMSVMITTFSVMANDSEFPKIRQFTAADGLSE